MSLSLVLMFAQVAPPVPPAPPVIVSVPQSPWRPGERALVSWMPGEVRCAGAVVQGAMVRRPLGTLEFGVQRAPNPVTYRFSIDGAGRPLSIARQEGATPLTGPDIGPALAASRFAGGSPQQECSVTYAARVWSMETAPVEDLVSYTISPTGSPLPREGWARIRAAGTCTDAPRPRVLLRAFPDFAKVAGTPGVKDWSLIGFDTDAGGVPVRMRTLHTTGNAALDAAAAKAVGESRFTGGARTDCLYPYWKAAEKLPAPPIPDEEALRPEGSVCASKPEWNSRPVLVFPEPWRRRAIEGWAVVSYDVAPWGAVGNARVLASQPSEDFGRQAMSIVQSGRVAASAQGATGCVETVRFVMGRGDSQPVDDEVGIF